MQVKIDLFLCWRTWLHGLDNFHFQVEFNFDEQQEFELLVYKGEPRTGGIWRNPPSNIIDISPKEVVEFGKAVLSLSFYQKFW